MRIAWDQEQTACAALHLYLNLHVSYNFHTYTFIWKCFCNVLVDDLAPRKGGKPCWIDSYKTCASRLNGSLLSCENGISYAIISDYVLFKGFEVMWYCQNGVSVRAQWLFLARSLPFLHVRRDLRNGQIYQMHIAQFHRKNISNLYFPPSPCLILFLPFRISAKPLQTLSLHGLLQIAFLALSAGNHAQPC